VTALVSIVIPTYNSLAYVCTAIDSCLQQTYTPLEIIVVDDGSSDGTGDSLSTRYSNQIRYIAQKKSGPALARNRGIE
jgi:glycosyltransferase involved in cell wall biosynthesis